MQHMIHASPLLDKLKHWRQSLSFGDINLTTSQKVVLWSIGVVGTSALAVGILSRYLARKRAKPIMNPRIQRALNKRISRMRSPNGGMGSVASSGGRSSPLGFSERLSLASGSIGSGGGDAAPLSPQQLGVMVHLSGKYKYYIYKTNMAPKKDKGKKKAPQVNLKAVANAPPPKPKPPPKPPACFKDEDIMRFKECFKLFDTEGIDKVPLQSIPIMLRKLGFNPKGAQIQYLFEQFLEDEYVDTVEFPQFLFMVEAKMKMGDDFENDVMKAMAALGHDDEETGFAKLGIIREELMTWGEPLSEIEFIDLPKLATKDKTYNNETDLISYNKFIENMNAKDALLRAIQEPVNFFKLDQKTLAEMARKKAQEEKEEAERKEAEKRAREEQKRQKMIADGLLPPDP